MMEVVSELKPPENIVNTTVSQKSKIKWEKKTQNFQHTKLSQVGM